MNEAAADPIRSFLGGDDSRTVVVESGGRAYACGELRMMAVALRSRIASLGLAEGSRIAALMPNSAGSVAAFLAAAGSGHCYLPLNIGLKTAELAEVIERCDVRAVLGLRDRLDELPEGVAGLAVEGCVDSHERAIGNEWDPGRAFVCLSTSGSTGWPRFAERTAGAVFANSLRVGEALGVEESDRVLSVVPFWHANGFSNCLVMPLLRGASLLTMDRFLPRQLLEAVSEHKVTVVVGSPFIFRALDRVLEPGMDLSHVRAWISSGARLPAALDDALRSRGVRVRQLYGSSETGTLCISSGEARPEGTVGPPLPGVDLRLVREDGSFSIGDGEIGDVRIRSDALFTGYVGEEGSPPFTSDGFYEMNDRAVFHDGELRLLGRSDAMINVAGNKVDPGEIRAVIERMPAVKQVLVFGAADGSAGEAVKALVVPDGSLSAADVLAHCRAHLAEYKLPRIIDFTDHIPEDLMGKSARRLLEN